MTPFVVEIPAGFAHHAALYVARPVPGSDGGASRYGVILPDVRELEGCYRLPSGHYTAATTKIPGIVAGDTEYDARAWQSVLERALLYRFPLDSLLEGRPLKVLCKTWEPAPSPFNRDGRNRVTLLAVNIRGDLTKSEALDAWIADARKAFAQ